MSSKTLVMLGVFIGSVLGSILSSTFGIDSISYLGIIFSSVGAFLGFLISYNLVKE